MTNKEWLKSVDIPFTMQGREDDMDSAYLLIKSNDSSLIHKVIDLISSTNSTPDKETMLRSLLMDPTEELDLRLAQIEGMTVRIHDLECKLRAAFKKYNP